MSEITSRVNEEEIPGITALAGRRPGRPAAGGENKHERILIEAFELFAQRGYSATSLGQVAVAADISKAGLLHYFGSKQGLFAAVLERRDELDRAGFPSGDDPWLLIDALVDLVRRNAGMPDMVGLYMFTAMEGVQAENPAHQWLLRHLSDAVGLFTRAFEQGKRDGSVHPDAPSRDLARILIATADGLQLQWLCSQAGSNDGAEANDNGGTNQGSQAKQDDVDMVTQFRVLVDSIRHSWEITSG